jgi:hypothetical protein
MFQSLVSVFAGYWNPTLANRLWVATFFMLVQCQRWLKFSRRFQADLTAHVPQNERGVRARSAG